MTEEDFNRDVELLVATFADRISETSKNPMVVEAAALLIAASAAQAMRHNRDEFLAYCGTAYTEAKLYRVSKEST